MQEGRKCAFPVQHPINNLGLGVYSKRLVQEFFARFGVTQIISVF